jgi:hypothetical protein
MCAALARGGDYPAGNCGAAPQAGHWPQSPTTSRRSTMHTVQASRLLKLALTIDAGASAALAALQLLMPALLADTLSLPLMLVSGSAVFLLAYALSLWALARLQKVWSAAVLFIVIGNVGWALACLALAATGLVTPSPLGVAFLCAQAGAVLLFAWLEHAGLQASAAAPTGDMRSADRRAI